MKVITTLFFIFLSTLWVNRASADVSCGIPTPSNGVWQVMCSDSTKTTSITHYACILKIAIETTDPEDNAKLVYHAPVKANAQDATIWIAEKFHGDPIASLAIDDIQCYAQR